MTLPYRRESLQLAGPSPGESGPRREQTTRKMVEMTEKKVRCLLNSFENEKHGGP
jgi:hypothetical protein